MVKREETKAILKEKILIAAREVFVNEGYESATISKIAETAGVGLGTAYNYFNSKEDLFILAMAEELVDASTEEQTPVYEADSPEEIVSAIVLGNIRRLNFFSKTIWRVTLSSIFSSLKSSNPVIRELIKADYRFMGNISSRIEELKKAGRLPETLSTETAVNLIYGSVMFNLMSYVYEENCSFEEICRKIKECIQYVLKDTNSNKGYIPSQRYKAEKSPLPD